MNYFILESFFIGLKEGLKVLFCTGLLVLFFDNSGRGALKKALFAGVLVVLLASLIAIRVPVTLETRGLLVKMIGFTFALFYLFALAALFHSTGTDILGPVKPLWQKNYFLVPLVFLLTVVYFIPDMTGSSLYLKDLSSMSGSRAAIIGGSGSGLGLAIALGWLLARRIPEDKGSGSRGQAARKSILESSPLTGLPQVLLLLALVKLVAGGSAGSRNYR